MEWIRRLTELVGGLDEVIIGFAEESAPWFYLGLSFSVFAETGFVVTPFFPGESLVFATSAMASEGAAPVNILFVGFLVLIATVGGDMANYGIARLVGHRIFRREGGVLFTKRQIETAQHYYDRYGGKTLFFCRYLPVIRTVAPFMAGVARMAPRRVFFYVFLGGLSWTLLYTVMGYTLGHIDAVRDRIFYVILIVVAVATLPGVIEILRMRRREM